MPQSLSKVLVHFVFSTKNREQWISDSVRDDLHAYIGGIIQSLSGTLLKAGSVEDHVHLLVAQPRTASLAQVIEDVKTGSSKMDQNEITGSDRISLAGWIRRVFHQPVPP